MLLTQKGQAPAVAPWHIQIRKPGRPDGVAVNELIARCPPLDRNSVYCNLLQCTHFAETSALAEVGDEVAGFVSGYLVPRSAGKTLFIWQVAIASEFRRQNLAAQLILDILGRRCCAATEWIESTITLSNSPSWNLFENVARQLNAKTRRETGFDSDIDFAGQHDSEIKLRIGPLRPQAALAAVGALS